MQVSSQTRPEPVTIEHTWYGKLKARFAEHITLQPAEEPGGENDAPTYCYDEYTYTADYSDQLAAAICNNRDYYLRLAKNAGFRNVYGIASVYTGPTLIHFMFREAVSITVSFLRGYL